MAVVTIAATAVLTGVVSLQYHADDAADRLVAEHMARQLMDEILGHRYPEDLQAGTGTRENYKDIDDFNNWRASPPVDPYGIPLGTDDGQGGTRAAALQAPPGATDGWERSVEIYYVRRTDDGFERWPRIPGTRYRVIEVTVTRQYADGTDRQLARLRRIIGYIPTDYIE